MTPTEPIPFDTESRRRLERHWLVAVAGRGQWARASRCAGVRGMVQASWRRSFLAEVSPRLPTAPVVQHSRTMPEAALEPGTKRSALYRRMERFGLEPRRVLARE